MAIKITMDDILDRFRSSLGEGRKSGNNIEQLICPVCGKKKLSVNVVLQNYQCWGCGADVTSGGIFGLWSELRPNLSKYTGSPEDRKAVGKDMVVSTCCGVFA